MADAVKSAGGTTNGTNQHEYLRNRRIRTFVKSVIFVDHRRRRNVTEGQTISRCTAAPRAGVAQKDRPFALIQPRNDKRTDHLHPTENARTKRRICTKGQTFSHRSNGCPQRQRRVPYQPGPSAQVIGTQIPGALQGRAIRATEGQTFCTRPPTRDENDGM